VKKPEPFRRWWRQDIALYRGDELIDSGTIKEIAERRGVRKDTIRWYLTGAATGGQINGKINRER
jgi:hypothetical protein